MTVTTGRWARSTAARWAGGLYLAYILANVLASSLATSGGATRRPSARRSRGRADVPMGARRGTQLGPALRPHGLGPWSEEWSTVSTMSGLCRSMSATSVRPHRRAAASMRGRRWLGSVTTRAVAGTSATADCFK
jgi:hypothetical protein